MYRPDEREELWNNLGQPWDVLVIGGGITGAGIFNLAARSGLKALLVDAGDYAFGTSSRSSKLVHGGFRYLKNRQFDITRESVRERERLLRQARGLVTPLKFLLPNLGFSRRTNHMFRVGVALYDLMAPKWAHGSLSQARINRLCPQLTNPKLSGGYYYYDAEVDDARLVLRILREGLAAGGLALNYVKAVNLLFRQDGQVAGALLADQAPGGGERMREVQAKVVINATGPWTDELRGMVGAAPCIRKQRGSHLILPQSRLPLTQAITLLHPRDKRAMFVFPWEGVTIIGTTDLDHPPELEAQHSEPAITAGEVGYILEALDYLFPQSQLRREDVLSTFSGLRPIVTSGEKNPSRESRKHALWEDRGLVTITGGKLTTYRIMARETLERCRPLLGSGKGADSSLPALIPATGETPAGMDRAIIQRLTARYGYEAAGFWGDYPRDEFESVSGLPALWVELRHAVRSEDVQRLDDLLLRRTRLGLTLPEGGAGMMERIRAIAQPELGWDDLTWQAEESRYLKLVQECYSIPDNV